MFWYRLGQGGMIQLGKAKAGLDIEESKENQGVDKKFS